MIFGQKIPKQCVLDKKKYLGRKRTSMYFCFYLWHIQIKLYFKISIDTISYIFDKSKNILYSELFNPKATDYAGFGTQKFQNNVFLIKKRNT